MMPQLLLLPMMMMTMMMMMMMMMMFDCVILDSQGASPPQLQLEFKCFLIDHKTNKHVPVSFHFFFVY